MDNPRNRIQVQLIDRFMRATAQDQFAWARYGYADAFDIAWKNGVRDPNALYDICLSTKSRVNSTLSDPA